MQTFHVIVVVTERGQVVWLSTNVAEVEAYYEDWTSGYGFYDEQTKVVGTVEAENEDQALIAVATRSEAFQYTQQV